MPRRMARRKDRRRGVSCTELVVGALPGCRQRAVTEPRQAVALPHAALDMEATVRMKVAIIFLYSTTITLVWWILLQSQSLAAWLFFLPAIGIGFALFPLVERFPRRVSISAALSQVMEQGRQLWNGRGDS
jgi:hypothetical protein